MLAVDQFEEVFTACSDAAERTAFLDAITEAAAEPDGPTTIVIAMRADFYGRCAEHRGLASLLASHQILVGPMDADELRRAIELPAQRADLTLRKSSSFRSCRTRLVSRVVSPSSRRHCSS